MGSATTLDELAAATPKGRDRYIDLLRAFSIAVVVLGHWLMAIVYLRAGELSGANALDKVPGLWIATWVLQVMPLFFMVGGFSNRVAWRSFRERDGGYIEYLKTRSVRLLRPTMIFIGVWVTTMTTIGIFRPNLYRSLGAITEIVAKPLWFLAVYVLVIALAPTMISFHERYGGRVLVVLGSGAVIVDMMRVGAGLPAVGYLNFAFVWLFVHQLGFFYADGRVTGRRSALAVSAIASLVTLSLLTGTGIYSPGMVGMESEAASNNSPPSICLIVLSVWLGSVAMLIRPRATRWLQRTRVWRAVIAANSIIMTVFLWHLTALLVGVLLLYPLGFPQPEGGTSLWWAWRPVWIGALCLLLLPFIAAFSRFERPARRIGTRSGRTHLPTIAGIAAVIAGLAGFAQFGFAAPAGTSGAPQAGPIAFTALLALGYLTLTSTHKIGGSR